MLRACVQAAVCITRACERAPDLCVSQDGRGPQTSLLPAVLAKLNLAKVEDLIAWTYADTVWARLAALAPHAFEEEKKGDAGAQASLRWHVC